MTTQTAEREQLQQIIEKLPDEKIPAVLLFVSDFYVEKCKTNSKAFTGIDDLKPLYVPGFKMYQREELHDR